MKKFYWGILTGILLSSLMLFGAIKWLPESFFIIPPGMKLADISDEDRKFYKSLFVPIRAGRYAGSGCKSGEDESEYYSSLHVILAAHHDKKPIFVGKAMAKLVSSSLTDQDLGILSTNLAAKPRDIELPEYKFREGEDVIIVGSPGNNVAMVQPGKIMNVKVEDDQGNLDPWATKVFTVYVEGGISGGCIYPLGSSQPVALFRKDENRPHSQIGHITFASKLLKVEER